MIPKRIIYCWFGGKEKPENVKNCIKTWKEKLKDWEFLEINEDNFDINYNQFTREAYKCKKWAFVSDVARLWALWNYGGVYMDTDVWVYQPLDKFLEYDFFTGFESVHYPVTAVMGASQFNDLIKKMLDVYDNKTFELKENWYEYETNTVIMSEIIGKYFDRDRNEYQRKDNMAIYPSKTFCNYEGIEDSETYTRHMMFGSWG